MASTGALAVLVTGMVTFAPAASANSVHLRFNGMHDGKVEGWWHDKTDRLCVKIPGKRNKHYKAVAVIYPTSAGPGKKMFKISDRGGGGRSCTKNLSIREDAEYVFELEEWAGGAHPTNGRNRVFHT
ncbi:hypothetical protein [Streptomyces oceani]|nr:hypothetical protein [Streptomyces oceani]